MHNHNRTVTVAIPTYNGAKFIVECINSIYHQSLSVNNIIITDDSSTDKTLEIVNNIPIKEKTIVKIFTNKSNIGYAANWNNCFRKCTTSYLVILHQDDLLKPNAIEKQIDYFMKNNQCALIGGQEDFIDENGKTIHICAKRENKSFNVGDIYEFIKETGSYIPCSSVMFDVEKIKFVGYFDENYLAADELFWPKVLNNYPIAILGESLIKRRIHPDQTEYSDFVNKFEKIIEAARAQYRIAEYEQDFLRRRKTLKILKEKTARNGVNILFKIRKNDNIIINYIIFILKSDALIILRKAFWRKIYNEIKMSVKKRV